MLPKRVQAFNVHISIISCPLHSRFGHVEVWRQPSSLVFSCFKVPSFYLAASPIQKCSDETFPMTRIFAKGKAVRNGAVPTKNLPSLHEKRQWRHTSAPHVYVGSFSRSSLAKKRNDSVVW